MKDIMIDLETLGTRTTSAIIQIGACYFDKETGEIGEEFSENIYHDDDRFTTDYHTIKWWMSQSDEARASLFEDAISINYAMEKLREFLKDGEVLWSHATFDIPIMNNSFDVVGIENPIPYRGTRDIRTLMDLTDHRSKLEREGIHHNALDDARFQVAYCVEALNKNKS